MGKDLSGLPKLLESLVRIDVLCSDPDHPVYPILQNWIAKIGPRHTARLISAVSELSGGDILFLISVAIMK